MTHEIRPDVRDVLVQHHREFLHFLEQRVGSHPAAEKLLQTAFVNTLEPSMRAWTARAETPDMTGFGHGCNARSPGASAGVKGDVS